MFVVQQLVNNVAARVSSPADVYLRRRRCRQNMLDGFVLVFAFTVQCLGAIAYH